jgi:hypothetical protein
MAKPRRPRDTNQLAKLIVELSTGEARDAPETPKARAGRLGGIKGGKARADALSPSRRKQIAKKAATARWKSR